MVLALPKERCQWCFLLPEKLLRIFDPISPSLILISLQKPLQMGRGGEKKPKHTSQATLSFCSFLFVFVHFCSFLFIFWFFFVLFFFIPSFLLFSFPTPSLEPLRQPHGRETKSLSSCFGLFFITSSVLPDPKKAGLSCFIPPPSPQPGTQFSSFQQMCQRYSTLPWA